MRNLFVIVITVFGLQCAAQDVMPDTLLFLNEVRINSTKLDEFNTGLDIYQFDSTELERYSSYTIDKALFNTTSLNVKNSGPSQLSTISFRGSSSVHTGVVWDGFYINPSNIGVFDFSLLPVSFFDNVMVQYGGMSSVFGSGSVGGGIHIGNKPFFDKGFQTDIELSAGCFGNYSGTGEIRFSTNKFYSKTALNVRKAKNDFTYRYRGEELRQRNAALESYGFIQELGYMPSDDQIIRFNIWMMNFHREIPGTITTKPGTAYQIDKSIRSSLHLNSKINKGLIKSRFAYICEYLRYVDDDFPATAIDSELRLNTFIYETDLTYDLSDRIKFNTGISLSMSKADIDAYNGIKKQRQAGILLSLNYKLPLINWNANINVRQDFIQDYNIPLAMSLGFQGKIWKIIFGKVLISRNYRAPTLNDRYWQPGGNEDLKVESGFNQEAGIIIRSENINSWLNRIMIRATYYNAIVDDWIQWLPKEGTGYWQPENVSKVWSRGIEAEGRSDIKIGMLKCKLRSGYNYVKSTYEESTENNKQRLGNQLIYTPEHKWYGRAGIILWEFTIDYTHTYTGKRYVSPDHSDYVPSFFIGDLSFSKHIDFKKYGINIKLDINNIWNTDYQFVKYRPMPGRSFILSLKCLIK